MDRSTAMRLSAFGAPPSHEGITRQPTDRRDLHGHTNQISMRLPARHTSACGVGFTERPMNADCPRSNTSKYQNCEPASQFSAGRHRASLHRHPKQDYPSPRSLTYLRQFTTAPTKNGLQRKTDKCSRVSSCFIITPDQNK